ncbi:MAG: hypoxanthine phosphoribosyltransferase [Myxococcales bacterium]|nr:MAG: hypoxanthine phosphoribosyltransferase [Myxococcales bacterium]
MAGEIRVLISEQQIAKRLDELAEVIGRDYKNRKLHCIGVLKGSFIFMADLVRRLPMDVSCDFLTISSYGDLTKSSGVVKLLTDLTVPIEGKDVLVVEDIVDTGLTLDYLLGNLKTRNPASLRVATLLHKPTNKKIEVPIHYCGFTVPDRFVVGYGLDNRQLQRNLPYIGWVPGDGDNE